MFKRPKGSPDPMSARIAARRKAKGYSYQRLAKEAGLGSASYILYIENGVRFPSERVAEQIARALDDDPELYRAWARLRSGRQGRVDYDSWILASDMYRALDPAPGAPTAREPGADPERHHLALHPLATDPTTEPGADPGRHSQAIHRSETVPLIQELDGDPDLAVATEVSMTFNRLVGPVSTRRIPVLNEGADPDQPHDITNFLLLDPKMYGLEAPQAIRVLAALRDPFAFLLGSTQASRAPCLLEGCYAILSRDPTAWESVERIEARAAYAVRVEDRIELVSGAALGSAAAIPDPLAAYYRRDPQELRARVIGKVEVILTGFR